MSRLDQMTCPQTRNLNFFMIRKRNLHLYITNDQSYEIFLVCFKWIMVTQLLTSMATGLLYSSSEIYTIWCTLQWRHNGCHDVSNPQPHDCLLNRLFRRRSKKTSKLRVTGPCEGISLMTEEFPAQRTSDVSIWWRHHGNLQCSLRAL